MPQGVAQLLLDVINFQLSYKRGETVRGVRNGLGSRDCRFVNLHAAQHVRGVRATGCRHTLGHTLIWEIGCAP